MASLTILPEDQELILEELAVSVREHLQDDKYLLDEPDSERWMRFKQRVWEANNKIDRLVDQGLLAESEWADKKWDLKDKIFKELE